MTGTVTASLLSKLRQPGMETRCPEGAGQRQRSWLGAKHDSPGSRQGSRPQSCQVTPSDSRQIWKNDTDNSHHNSQRPFFRGDSQPGITFASRTPSH
ncbi:hypothetical protein C2C86_17130 [Escherichia coli]|nr:hypothetical protein [Escherichia coli]EFO3683192.1 hypothetical protein [Escherichia coli]